MYVYACIHIQVLKSSRDQLIKDLDAKNIELSGVMTKAKERIDGVQKDLDKVTAEKDKLGNEYAELQKKNTVSRLLNIYTYV